MKYFILLPLLFLLGCKLDAPKEFEQYNCVLPTSISVTKDPVNGKKFSFSMDQPTDDIATIQWTIKSVNGTVVNTSNLAIYTPTLAAEGQYTLQANITSKCGENKIISTNFEAATVCNLTKREFYFKSGNYEAFIDVLYTYNALNEVTRDESISRENGKITSTAHSNYEKNEANLGSLTKPYILVKNDGGSIQEEIYCDTKKRVIKLLRLPTEITYKYGSDGFLEQETSISRDSPEDERRRNNEYSATGLTTTVTRFDKNTKVSTLSYVTVSLYSDKMKLQKYAVNYMYNYGNQPPKYFVNNQTTYYVNNMAEDVDKIDYVVLLDANNRPVSEKTIGDGFSYEDRKFVYNCK
jgi:hypothetical protein